MIVELGVVEGTTVEVPEGGTVDLTGDDQTYTAWTADIADPDVVEFVPAVTTAARSSTRASPRSRWARPR